MLQSSLLLGFPQQDNLTLLFEKCITLFTLQQQQVEIDRCLLRSSPLIAAVLADLPYECLEKGPALLTASSLKQLCRSASSTGTALTKCRSRYPL